MCSMYLFKGLLGCAGGFLMHLILGSIYQWGIINVYISSYFTIVEGVTQSLTVNGVIFPTMMICIAFGMRVGNYLCDLIGIPIVMGCLSIVLSGLVFGSSYVSTFAVFAILYGVLFGFFVGFLFTSTLRQVNKYFVNKQIYVNGFILIGTGLGSAVFGPFSYSYLNPQKLAPINGLYITPQLSQIALRVPSCLRYLSLFYIVFGLAGTLCLIPIYLQNKKKLIETQAKVILQQNTQQNIKGQGENNIVNEMVANTTQPKPNIIQSQNQVIQHQAQLQTILNQCPNLKTAFTSRNTYMLALVLYTMILGNLFVNTSYKTFVRRSLSNDQFLTMIGAFASIANGFTRLPSSLLYNKIGFKYMTCLIGGINTIVYCTIRLAVFNEGVYCFLVIVCNLMLGSNLAIITTQLLRTFGARTGSDIYSIYWACLALANFTAYGLAIGVDLNICFYIFAGTSVFSSILVWFVNLNIDWNQKSKPIELHPFPVVKS